MKTKKQDRRVLYTGSRIWSRPYVVRYSLKKQLEITDGVLTVVHGACKKGVDYEADQWARSQSSAKVVNEPHPAEWHKNKRHAGFIRNQDMVDLGADVCVALVQDGSNGATHCYQRALEARIPVILWEASSVGLLAADAFYEAADVGAFGREDIIIIAGRMTEDHVHRDETMDMVSEWAKQLADLSPYEIYRELESDSISCQRLDPPEIGIFESLLD